MKIDAHQHFWIYNSSEYGWIGHNMDMLKRNYTPEDLYNELIKAGYSGSVAVQARQSVEETRWLLELAGKHDFIRGVVGWADLSGEDDLRRQLDDFCRNEKLVGLRHVIHDEPADSFMLRDDFLKGISILKEYDLAFDLLLFPKHLPVAQRGGAGGLAIKCLPVRIVIAGSALHVARRFRPQPSDCPPQPA